MRRRRRALGAVLTAYALVLGLAACAEEETPAEAVPRLVERLAAVDAAVLSGREAELRRAVRRLQATTEDARADGDLTEAQAEEILVAAAAVLAVEEASALKPSPSGPSAGVESKQPEPVETEPPAPAPTSARPEPTRPGGDAGPSGGGGKPDKAGNSGKGGKPDKAGQGSGKGQSKGKGKGKGR